ncbi:hypothetical protein ACOME3_006494 [Neoechinorhynchus agilis]
MVRPNTARTERRKRKLVISEELEQKELDEKNKEILDNLDTVMVEFKRRVQRDQWNPIVNNSSRRRCRRQYSIPKLSFVKTFRSIFMSVTSKRFRVTSAALDIFQLAAENELVGMMELSRLLICHARRKTFMLRDLALYKSIYDNFVNKN